MKKISQRFSTFGKSFLNKYLHKSWVKNVLMIIIASFIYSTCQSVFLAKAKVFPTGLSSIAQLFVFLFPSIGNNYFGLLYLVLNIPFLIFTFWKYPLKSFPLYSLIFMIFLTAWGFIIPHISFITDLNPVGVKLDKSGFVPSGSGWAVLIYAGLGGLLIGISVSMSFKNAASSGGTDLIVVYISWKSGRSIGGLSRTFSLALVIIAIISNSANDGQNVWEGLTSVYAIGSYVFIIVFSLTLNFFYPKYRKVKIAVSTSNPDLIIKALKAKKYARSYTIFKVKSGYTELDRYQIETITFFFEKKEFIETVLQVDNKAWFAVSRVENTIGRFIRKN